MSFEVQKTIFCIYVCEKLKISRIFLPLEKIEEAEQKFQ